MNFCISVPGALADTRVIDPDIRITNHPPPKTPPKNVTFCPPFDKKGRVNGLSEAQQWDRVYTFRVHTWSPATGPGPTSQTQFYKSSPKTPHKNVTFCTGSTVRLRIRINTSLHHRLRANPSQYKSTNKPIPAFPPNCPNF